MRMIVAAVILAAAAAPAWACPTHDSAQTPIPGTVVQTPVPAPPPATPQG